jgi:hypothetical protein
MSKTSGFGFLTTNDPMYSGISRLIGRPSNIKSSTIKVEILAEDTTHYIVKPLGDQLANPRKVSKQSVILEEES